ncbi:MAG: hypothetical protein LBJ48_08055 [Coriobacteriales bacterium]|jgi:hypothetical protein|nr:hypothetical protein [Coriobacteriales bacterium]
MSQIDSKEQAENYVFAHNAQQSKVFNTFNLYAIAFIGFVFAAVEYVVGLSNDEMLDEVLAYVQTAFALSGLIFAVWSSRTKKNAVQNTYLLECGLVFEVAGLVLVLVMTVTHLLSPETPMFFYLVPWAVYLLSFLITYSVVHARAAIHKNRVAKTTTFGAVIVILIIGIFIGQVGGSGITGFMDSLDASAQGLAVIGAGSLLALILGLLTAINFFKNLLVKKFDIDLSRLYI